MCFRSYRYVVYQMYVAHNIVDLFYVKKFIDTQTTFMILTIRVNTVSRQLNEKKRANVNEKEQNKMSENI
jgi:hypothetical protein